MCGSHYGIQVLLVILTASKANCSQLAFQAKKGYTYSQKVNGRGSYASVQKVRDWETNLDYTLTIQTFKDDSGRNEPPGEGHTRRQKPILMGTWEFPDDNTAIPGLPVHSKYAQMVQRDLQYAEEEEIGKMDEGLIFISGGLMVTPSLKGRGYSVNQDRDTGIQILFSIVHPYVNGGQWRMSNNVVKN